MTLKQIKAVLEESKQIGTVQEAYFESGEPFLFYPIMVEGIRLAREMGFKAGIVSNGYWSTCVGGWRMGQICSEDGSNLLLAH